VCAPIIYNGNISTPLYSIVTEEDGSLIKLDPNAIAYPCGLIAKSNFTDNFTLSTKDFTVATKDDYIVFNEDKIAWTSDIAKF